MKKNLLSLSLLLSVLWFCSPQYSAAQVYNSKSSMNNADVSVYPNPMTEYIGVNNDDLVAKMFIYNVVGKRLREFAIERGERYPVYDLPNGIYLVQLLTRNNKILTTQRINKRS